MPTGWAAADGSARREYPSDLSDAGWAFIVPPPRLLGAAAPRREYPRRAPAPRNQCPQRRAATAHGLPVGPAGTALVWAGVFATIVHALCTRGRVVGLYRGTGTVSPIRHPGGSPFW